VSRDRLARSSVPCSRSLNHPPAPMNVTSRRRLVVDALANYSLAERLLGSIV